MSDWFKRVFLGIAILGLLLPGAAQAQNGLSRAAGAAAVFDACPDPATDPIDIRTPCFAIVSFDSLVSRDDRAVVVRGTGASVRFNFSIVDAAAVLVPNEAAYWALVDDPDVTAFTPDRRVEAFGKPDKPGGGNKNKDGGGDGGTETVPSGVERIGGYATGYTGMGVTAWIVDTGLDSNHADISPGYVDGVTCFGDSAGAICVEDGGEDDNGHGTHVGGIVGAAQNGADVVGVAPGVWLMSVKVLDSSGSGYDSNVIAGLNYIANYIAANLTNGDVVNMSLGRPGSVYDNPLLRQAVQALFDADVTVVVAAGNDPFSEITEMVPASYPEVMAVASTTAEDGNNKCRSYSGRIWADTASYFTTDGTGVAISAPGAQKENISRGCRAQSVGILSLALGGGTTRKSGTSMASPHVAGVVALMLQATPGLAPNTVRSIIQGTADKCGTAALNSPTNGYSFDGVREGIVDAYAAVNDLACPPPAS